MTRSSHERKRTAPAIKPASGLQALVKAWHDAQTTEMAAMAQRRRLAEQLIAEVEPLWRERCRADGTRHDRIVIQSLGASTVAVAFHRRCRTILGDREEELRSVFGNAMFDRCFESRCVLHIDPAKLTEQQVEKMAEAFGDSLADIVTVESRIVPRDAYHCDRILDDRIATCTAQAEAAGLVIQFAPTVTSK